jgi:Protein of unknown function (DUF3754)
MATVVEAGAASGAASKAPSGADVIAADDARARETFIPLTKSTLMRRLTAEAAWPAGNHRDARKFFQYLDHWRRQLYNHGLREIDQSYEAFSPDTDLLSTRSYTDAEKLNMQGDIIKHMVHLLTHANYVRIDPAQVELILTRESYYGLDLHVDLSAFEELMIFYRGASTKKEMRRVPKKFYRKVEFDVPIYRRLFVLFKIKPFDKRVAEVMVAEKIGKKEAERMVRKMRKSLPEGVNSDLIYMKMFKNMPRSDIEMIFPNTAVKFRLFDKLKLGLTSSAGLGMGAFGAAGKIALAATNPLAAAGAVAGLGGVAVRQGVAFMNQRQKYMVVMAQNLYFHALADNRGVMIKLADRAAEEDVKEEMLLYAVLAKTEVNRRDLEHVDDAIERYLKSTFEIDVDFDLNDALDRLLADGIVTEDADGTLRTLSPAAAAKHIDSKWDGFLDVLAEDKENLGVELDTGTEVQRV